MADPHTTAREARLAEIQETLFTGGYDGTEDNDDTTWTDFGEAVGIAAALAADLAAARAREDTLREALRAEVKKRHHYKDGSQPNDEWLDAKIAEMYPALASVPATEPAKEET